MTATKTTTSTTTSGTTTTTTTSTDDDNSSFVEVPPSFCFSFTSSSSFLMIPCCWTSSSSIIRKMGNTSSSNKKELTPLQRDIKYLGDRMPFGDAELYHVYQAYNRLIQKQQQQHDPLPSSSSSSSSSNNNEEEGNNNNKSEEEQQQLGKISFLTDIGIETSSTKELSTERLMLLQVIEQKILPLNFGNQLYKSTFLRSQDQSVYDNDTTNNKEQEQQQQQDEYTRLARIEKFFDGISNCGRRGAKSTLKVLVACCESYELDDDDQEDTGPMYMSPTTPQFLPPSGQSTMTTTTTTTNNNNTSKVGIDPLQLVNIGYRVALASAFLKAASKDDGDDIGRFIPPNNDSTTTSPALQALTNSLIEISKKRRQHRFRHSIKTSTKEQQQQDSTKKYYVTETDVIEWAESVAPLFASSLATFTHTIFFPNKAYPPSRTSFDYPRIPIESTFFNHGSSSLLFSFGCMSSSLSGEFYRLYTSASDGLSFNRLQNALLGYGGPTLIIIQSDDNTIFGAYTASSWKESKDFYGNTDCFLYQLLPTTAVYRPTGNGTNYMYCNSFARSRGYDKQAHGIGFGGTVTSPRLFIAENFDDNIASIQDITFEKGPLLGGTSNSNSNSATTTTTTTSNKQYNFYIDNLEVWGVGGDDVVMEALGARNRDRAIRDANIQKARKVDKAAFLDDFRSGLIDSKAFAHRQQIQGRDGVCALDDKFEQSYSEPNKGKGGK